MKKFPNVMECRTKWKYSSKQIGVHQNTVLSKCIKLLSTTGLTYFNSYQT